MKATNLSGKYYIPFFGGNIAGARSIGIQQDGKLLFGGYMDDNTLDRNFALARTSADGALDAGFDTDGKVETDLGSYDQAYSLAVQDDGLILLAGRTSTTDMDFALVRYISGVDVGIGDVETYIGTTLVYPNPIRNRTLTVEYELKQRQKLALELFDVTGNLVAVLKPSTELRAGSYRDELKLPSSVSSGNYLLRLNTEKGSVSVRLAVF